MLTLYLADILCHCFINWKYVVYAGLSNTTYFEIFYSVKVILGQGKSDPDNN